MKILLVEDEALIAMEQQLYLELAGHEVCGPAIDSHSAIAMAAAHPHDLALVDVHLARNTSGIDAARRMSELGLPCLFVTSHPEGVLAERIGLGCLIKPFTEQDLVTAVEVAGALIGGRAPEGANLRNLILFVGREPSQAGG